MDAAALQRASTVSLASVSRRDGGWKKGRRQCTCTCIVSGPLCSRHLVIPRAAGPVRVWGSRRLLASHKARAGTVRGNNASRDPSRPLSPLVGNVNLHAHPQKARAEVSPGPAPHARSREGCPTPPPGAFNREPPKRLRKQGQGLLPTLALPLVQRGCAEAVTVSSGTRGRNWIGNFQPEPPAR